MKKIETSKKVLGGTLIFCGVAAIVVLYGWLNGAEDATGMLGVIAGTGGIALGFYNWKARAENLIKLSREKIDGKLMEMISKMTSEDEEL